MLRHATAVGAYGVLTLGLTWPLILRIPSAVPNDLGDPLLTTWILWWNATVTPLTEQWWNGAIFHPGANALALSDHRLGLSPITSPLIRLGASPLIAYNTAFLLTFLLSATSAYALGFALTRSYGAAFVAGLVYGFNPFRADHLSHLELLAAYSMPLGLLALHQWHRTTRGVWLIVLGGALTMQAFTSGYYFVFFGVLVGLWLIWYRLPPLPIRRYVGLGFALAFPIVAVTPVLLRYRRAHEAMGLSRPITEIELFSADLMGLLARPTNLAFWSTPPEWAKPEGALYPGLTALALVLVALFSSRRPGTRSDRATWIRRVRAAVVGACLVMFVAAFIPVFAGPVATELGGLRISITDFYKPFSIGLLLLFAWLLTTRKVSDAWRTRSHLAFYALATVAMWIFALGPTGRVLGERFWYKAPYSWLMELGAGSAFRVPARFGMLAALTLSAATAVALSRLARSWPRHIRLAVVGLASVLIMIESWIRPLSLNAPPAFWQVPADVPSNAAVLELPIEAFKDAAAMYRAIEHGHLLVNGLSGYNPPHYDVLVAAMQEFRLEVLPVLAASAPLAIVVDRTAGGPDLSAMIQQLPSTRLVARTDSRDVILLEQSPSEPPVRPPGSTALSIAALTGYPDPGDWSRAHDEDRDTFWISDSQHGDQELIVDTGMVNDISAVSFDLGAVPAGFPRELSVSISAAGETWEEVWHGETAALALTAALTTPRDVTIPIHFVPRRARFVRLRQLGHATAPWVVAEIRVWGNPQR